MDLAFVFKQFVRNATFQLKRQSYATINLMTRRIRCQIWENLLDMRRTLEQQAQLFLRLNMPSETNVTIQSLRNTLNACEEPLDNFLHTLAEVQLPDSIASGVYWGGRTWNARLRDKFSQNVNWAPLLNRQCGALRAMDMLQLELLALPGARLAPEKQVP